MKAVAAIAALSLLAITGRADAKCELERPSDVCDPEVPPQPVVVIQAERPEEPAGFQRRGAHRTHGIGLESGHLLEPATFQVNARAFGLVTDVGVGLHDRIELSAQVVGFGVAGGLGARLSLTDRDNPFRLLVNARLWALEGSNMRPLQLGATMAYQFDRLNVHVNLMEMPSPDGRVWQTSIGGYYEISELVSIGGEVGRVAIGPSDSDAIGGVVAGIKLTGERFDLDLGAGAFGGIGAPLIGLTARL